MSGTRALLPMQETEKRFCKDCRYRGGVYLKPDFMFVMQDRTDECAAPVTLDPIHGLSPDWTKCRERNANFDCALFERESEPEPKRPWWRCDIGYLTLFYAALVAAVCALVAWFWIREIFL